MCQRMTDKFMYACVLFMLEVPLGARCIPQSHASHTVRVACTGIVCWQARGSGLRASRRRTM